MKDDALSRDEPGLQETADRAAKDEATLPRLLADISPENKDANRRYRSFRALLLVCEARPDLLYERWPYFVELLGSGSSFSVINGLNIIARLASIDTEGRFERIFDLFFGLLDHQTVMVASQVAINAGRIARARPGLRRRVTKRLLDIDATHHDPERRDLMKAYAIESLGEYFEEADNKDDIAAFVRNQLDSKSPKTRKLARAFLKAHQVG